MNRRESLYGIFGLLAVASCRSFEPPRAESQIPDARVVDAVLADARLELVDCMSFEIGGPADGHVMTVIPAQDIAAGVEKTYMLSGGQHSHMLTITAEQFGMLAQGATIDIESTRDVNHVHPLTIGMCTRAV